MFLDLLERRTGKVIGRTALVLREAFTMAELEELLRTRLDVRLQNLSAADNMQRAAYQVARSAVDAGWLPDLLRAVKEERPHHTRLLAECDEILALYQQSVLPPTAEGRPPRARTVNVVLGLVLLLALAAWGILLFGLPAGYSVLGALGAWGGANVLQFFLESEKFHRLDRWLTRLADRRSTSYFLEGLLAVGAVASLFVGTVEAPPEDDELPVRVITDVDPTGRRLDAGKRRLYYTTPWPGRTVTVRAEGYQPLELAVRPWWRRRLRVDWFQLAPYVLLVPADIRDKHISNRDPWQLEIVVDGEKQTVENYIGQLILLWDKDQKPDRVPVPESVKKQHHYAFLRTKDGVPAQPSPPVDLRAGSAVSVRRLKPEKENGVTVFKPEPGPAFTFTVFTPTDRQKVLETVLLVGPK